MTAIRVVDAPPTRPDMRRTHELIDETGRALWASGWGRAAGTPRFAVWDVVLAVAFTLDEWSA